MAALIYAARTDDCPYEIALAVSDQPDASGLTLAAAEGVATLPIAWTTKPEFEAELDAALRAAHVEVIALAGFMRILSADFVARWAERIVNIHPSLLPKYKGLHTHERALAAGDRVAGCSVHLVTATLDDGPVLGRTEVAVLPGDTPDTLAARVLIAEHQLYPRVLVAYLTRERDPDWIIARVGGDKSGKFFAYVSVRHHGEDAVALLVKTSGPDEMAALIEAEPDLYYRPAYYGASGWIALRLDRAGVDWDHVGEWLARSWRTVAPKRLTKLIDVAADF